MFKPLKLTGVNGTIKARQRIEQTIALVTVKALLDAGYSLGVYDGEELVLHHSRSVRAIQDALFNTDDDYLYVYVKGGNTKDYRCDYFVHFVYGNDGWDVISDYSVKLEPELGKGIVKLITDQAEEFGTVPDLNTFLRNQAA